MKAFFESELFWLVIEALFTVVFTVIVLSGNVQFLTVLILVGSAVSVGWHFKSYLEERRVRTY